MKTEIVYLGTDTWIPSAGRDTASLVINRKYLVDTGWSCVRNMLAMGLDPLELEYLFCKEAIGAVGVTVEPGGAPDMLVSKPLVQLSFQRIIPNDSFIFTGRQETQTLVQDAFSLLDIGPLGFQGPWNGPGSGLRQRNQQFVLAGGVLGCGVFGNRDAINLYIPEAGGNSIPVG